ncbi:MAG TPA: DUF1028 domain-containing protein [Bacteroidales bacterium]|nr:DUF1028 domain-containing protein [Bacteroidales bacterium]
MRPILIYVFMFFLTTSPVQTVTGQAFNSNEPLANTFSIVAQDPLTGEMAVGVQSHWFSVGSIVSWGESGVGVVATQSFVNPAFGPDGLALLKNGLSAEEAVKTLTHKDEGRDFRQLAIVDTQGNASAFTGSKCIRYAGHLIGDGYSVQANMMLNEKVVPAMARAYEANADLPLAERVIKVMMAAQEAGGDIRGKQSAVLLVVGAKPAEHLWMDKKINLRVDDSEEPIKELDRLLKVHRAYEHMNNGDLAIEVGDMSVALQEYGAAEKMFPENLEMKFWKAVALANNGRIKEALPIFREIFIQDDNWRELTRRLPESALLNTSREELKMILDL